MITPRAKDAIISLKTPKATAFTILGDWKAWYNDSANIVIIRPNKMFFAVFVLIERGKLLSRAIYFKNFPNMDPLGQYFEQ